MKSIFIFKIWLLNGKNKMFGLVKGGQFIGHRLKSIEYPPDQEHNGFETASMPIEKQ